MESLDVHDVVKTIKGKKGCSIIYFWAEWCKPCVGMTDTIVRLEEMLVASGLDVDLYRLEVPSTGTKGKSVINHFDVAFDVRVIMFPALVLIYNGEVIRFKTPVADKDYIAGSYSIDDVDSLYDIVVKLFKKKIGDRHGRSR